MKKIDYIVACICRKEEQYIEEFVKYHLELGFDKIIIGDNNDVDQNNYQTILKQYIQNDTVEIIDLRGKLCQQLPFYNMVIDNYSYKYCAFIDCDEFITFSNNIPKKEQNIKNFFNNISNKEKYFDAIKLNWMCYGSNGLIYNDKRPVLERFTKSNPIEFKYNYNFPENYHAKTILKGEIKNKFYGQSHSIAGIRYVQPTDLITCGCSPFNEHMDFDTLYIRHFYTKSFQEWVEKKMEKRTADFGYNMKPKTVEDYLKYNQNDVEKVKEVLNNGTIKLIY